MVQGQESEQGGLARGAQMLSEAGDTDVQLKFSLWWWLAFWGSFQQVNLVLLYLKKHL